MKHFTKESPVNEFSFNFNYVKMLESIDGRWGNRLLKKAKTPEVATEKTADHKGWILPLSDGYIYDECKRFCDLYNIQNFKVRVMSYTSEDYLDWHVDPDPKTTRINILLTDPYPTVFKEEGEFRYRLALCDTTRRLHKFDNRGKPYRALVRLQIDDYNYDEMVDLFNQKNDYFWHDYDSVRETNFLESKVIKKVNFTHKIYADRLEECYNKLDRSKFKSNIISFDYNRTSDKSIEYTMPKLDMRYFVESDKTGNRNIKLVNIDHIVQLWEDFVENCNEGYPVHFDSALKNMFIIDNDITLIDLDSFVINPNKQAFGLFWLLRVWQRLTRQNHNIPFDEIYKRVGRPKFEDKYYEKIFTCDFVKDVSFVRQGLHEIRKHA